MTKKIGRREKILFPDMGILADAKIDTGAWRNSLHVDGIEVNESGLRFWIGGVENSFLFEKYKVIKVRSSFGKIQKRYLVKMRMKLGDTSYKILVSLANRKNMKFPCLIGRKFLHKFGFMVDVRQKNIHDRTKEM